MQTLEIYLGLGSRMISLHLLIFPRKKLISLRIVDFPTFVVDFPTCVVDFPTFVVDFRTRC